MHLLPLLAFAVCTTAGAQPLTDRIIALRAGTLLEVKRDAMGRKAELYATGVGATATARDQGLRVRSFSPDGNALVCENRFASYVVSLADGSTAKLPGIFHSWSPRGDLLACNGNYRYPAQHFGLQPYFWDRTRRAASAVVSRPGPRPGRRRKWPGVGTDGEPGR